MAASLGHDHAARGGSPAHLAEDATYVDLEAIARVNDPVRQVMTETWRLTEHTEAG